MTTQELNIANALLTTKEVLVEMISQGLGGAKYVYALSNVLVENFKLTQEQSLIVIKKALSTI